jgi:ligand-binding sensor domain-containing protein
VKSRAFLAVLAAAGALFASATAHACDATRGEELDVSAHLDVSALAASNERVYVGSFDRGLYVLEQRRTLRPVADPALGPDINALAWSEREHTLWVGTARGLTRCPTGKSCARVGPESSVHAVALAASGVVIAGGDAGLVFVDGERVRTYGKKEGAPFRSVWALAEVGGRLFAGTTSGLFWGAPAAFSSRHAALGRAAIVLGTLPDDWVTALGAYEDELLVGTYGAGVAEFRNGESGLAPARLEPALGYVNPAGITTLGPECAAVATMDGLRVGPMNGAVAIPTRARDVTAVVADPNGGYWIGTRAGLEPWLGRCPSSAPKPPA